MDSIIPPQPPHQPIEEFDETPGFSSAPYPVEPGIEGVIAEEPTTDFAPSFDVFLQPTPQYRSEPVAPYDSPVRNDHALTDIVHEQPTIEAPEVAMDPEPIVNLAPAINSESVSTENFQETSSATEESQNELQNFVEPNEPVQTISDADVFAPEAPTEKVSYADSSIQELEVSKIVANPFQPRTQFKPEALQELADSIREHGVIQPLVVTETPSGYELVVGERRFRASQLAGLTKVPAIVKKTLHDQTKLEVALIENIQRQELNAIEEARGYDRLIKSFNLTQDQVAKKVGKSRSAVANTLRLLNLPAEIQRGVIEGRITEGHARAILGLGEIEKMILMYQKIIDEGWNVRQVEAKVREITVKRRIDAATPDPKLMAIETELRGKLGAQVKIQRQGRGGKIMIDFFSDEDLDEILNRMAEAQDKEEGNYFTV
jgi:ParB family transcriptional regulator, chromosome partitioning protein